jgi:hypothetical protein
MGDDHLLFEGPNPRIPGLLSAFARVREAAERTERER